MLRKSLDWLDDRTQYRQLVRVVGGRTLSGGPSWWYTIASCLFWLMIVELVTGFFLMTTYSPSTTSSWASVHYIERDMAGSLVRGLHYYAAQAMIILFAIHVVRVLLTASFRAPRELIWITGLLLIPWVLIWAITGNPLSGSQAGISQIEVEGNIMGSTPVIGQLMRRILIGGEDVGHLTLTHLYFLHVGLLPAVVGLLLVVHLMQLVRHGVSPTRKGRACPYWPDQTVRNMAVLSLVLAAITALAWWRRAPLEIPADPLFAHSPRPEWYFRSLFELRRYFTGDAEIVATLVIPLTVFVLLLVVPLVDRFARGVVGGIVRILVVLAVFGPLAGLTAVSLQRDWNDSEYLESRQRMADLAARARTLADHNGVPPEGAIRLLREDPKTQGPLLFERHCRSCHSHADAQGRGLVADEPSAPNLFGFGSVQWLKSLLDPEQIGGVQYFGNTAHAEGDMVGTVQDLFDGIEPEEARQLQIELGKIARALSAEAGLPSRAAADQADQEMIQEGVSLLVEELACIDCHRFHDEGDLGSAPDLTGYGSAEWLAGMISQPNAERFYPEELNDRMPAFAEDPDGAQHNLLSPAELRLLVDWLRGDWYEATGD